MIKYNKTTLGNGLTVVVNRDGVSALSAINILYKVGARNESPERTGFAHLFEHLMFRGTEQHPSYDEAMQRVMGENNAFTSNDYTDFYVTLPAFNIERALEIEADRMRGLALTHDALEAEKRVVIEEYKQRYLNQPYGDHLMLLKDLCYKVHPYRWATIGLSTEHIAAATMEDVKAFYDNFYRPSNAVLSISANIEPERLFEMAEQWFGAIEDRALDAQIIPSEPEQREARRLEVERRVPSTCVTIAFKMGARRSESFYVADIITDLLAGGDSGRLYQQLVKRDQIAATANAYVTGEIDPGLFIFTVQLLPEVTPERCEAAIWAQIERLKREPVSDYELEKVKNKFEAGTTFGEINVMNKAMNLGFYEMLGDLPLINNEVGIFRSITPEQIMDFACEWLTPERSNTLIYKALASDE